jgi:inositol hexakisphosphate/diphosphoinositol-pentakisphosphate kinase
MVAMILDAIGVPTPKRIEVNRDGGPKLDPRVAEQLMKELGIDVNAPKPYQEAKMKNEDVLVVGNKSLEKSYVEKPVSGEDHNVWIYFSKRRGGGGRRLFRKVRLTSLIQCVQDAFSDRQQIERVRPQYVDTSRGRVLRLRKIHGRSVAIALVPDRLTQSQSKTPKTSRYTH